MVYKQNKQDIKISKKDAYRYQLYKGWDYNYSKDEKAIIYAKSVKNTANKYRKQLTICKKILIKINILFFCFFCNSISTASIL